MYIDARKFNYKKLGLINFEEQESRDKIFTEDLYKNWLNENLASIIERIWEVEDIGVVERSGAFIKLLKEAEFCYSLGNFQSAIALTGVCAEDLCRYFADSSGKNYENDSQFDRINKLKKDGLLNQAQCDDFHTIRKIRNDCLHFNENFKNKSEPELKADALTAINTIKAIYSSIIGVLDYSNVDTSSMCNLITKISEEAAKSPTTGIKNIQDAQIRLRNVFGEVFGVNLSLDLGGKPQIRSSAYNVKEIDLDIEPKEITLACVSGSGIVCVDLTEQDIEAIEEQNIKEESIVVASILSTTDKLGMTSQWRLLSITKLKKVT